jgi:hypothetical protein
MQSSSTWFDGASARSRRRRPRCIYFCWWVVVALWTVWYWLALWIDSIFVPLVVDHGFRNYTGGNWQPFRNRHGLEGHLTLQQFMDYWHRRNEQPGQQVEARVHQWRDAALNHVNGLPQPVQQRVQNAYNEYNVVRQQRQNNNNRNRRARRWRRGGWLLLHVSMWSPLK